MARRLNIGLYQGPPTLVAQTGKYGLLSPRATFARGGGSGPTGRRYTPGHYVAWPLPLGAAGIPNGGTVDNTPYPNAVVTGATWSNAGPAVKSSSDGTTGSLVTAGFVLRFYWQDIETTAGTFNYSATDKQLAQARALGMPAMIAIVVRTFNGNGTVGDGTNPLPADLRAPIPASIYGYANAFTTSASGTPRSGFQVWRWSPTIRLRFANLCSKLGARYNADPFFAGIATQETATGGVPGGSGQDAYSAAGYLAGLEDESDSISTNCPNAMAFPYVNFMTGGGQTQLNQFAAYAQPNGSWMGCPDLVTGSATSGGGNNTNIVNNVYPILNKFHNGTSPVLARGPTFAGVQHGEWNGSGVGDTPVSLGNLFNYATASFSCKPANGFTGALDWSGSAGRTSLLKCDGIVWDYDTSGSPNFATNLVPLMKAFPTFGTWTP